MDYIEIQGFKSIKDAKIDLAPINILIGANGSGKSNFLSFFEFLYNLYERKLHPYVAERGGVEKFLYQGKKITSSLSFKVRFKEGINTYHVGLRPSEDRFIFVIENIHYGDDKGTSINTFKTEANLKISDKFRATYTSKFIEGVRKYHFHDTGSKSPFSQYSHIENDIYYLYKDGRNLAAFLYNMSEHNYEYYRDIISAIQSIAPFFSDFFLQPNEGNYVRLQWRDKYSDTIYGPNDLSDGTIRFIALATLFMQPNLPDTIIIDEPELGLHPFALAKLAGMIQSVSQIGTQVIMATHSTDLLNHFKPEDIITVDQRNGESTFNRLKESDLSVWLEKYAVGDLWQRNIIQGGQPF